MYEIVKSSVNIIFYVLVAVVIISAVVKMTKNKKNK